MIDEKDKFVSLLEKIDKQIINANNHLIKKNSNLDYWNLILKGLTMFRADVVDCLKEREKAIQNDKNLSLSTINIPSSKAIEEAVKDIVRKIYEEIERINKRFFGEVK